MIRVLYRHRSGTIINDCPIDQIPAVLKDSRSRIWVDVLDEPEESAATLLHDTFQFEPLPQIDTEGIRRHTSIDDTGESVHITIVRVDQDGETGLGHVADDYFLGVNYLVTKCYETNEVIDNLWDAQERREELIGKGCGALLAELLQPIAQAVEPELSKHQARIEELSDQLYSSEEVEQRKLLLELQQTKMGLRTLSRELEGLSTVLQHLIEPSMRSVGDDARARLKGDYQRLQILSTNVRELTEQLDTLITVTATLSFTAPEQEYERIKSLVTLLSLPLILIALLIVSTLLIATPAVRPWIYAVGWLLFLLFLGGMLFYSRRRGWL